MTRLRQPFPYSFLPPAELRLLDLLADGNTVTIRQIADRCCGPNIESWSNSAKGLVSRLRGHLKDDAIKITYTRGEGYTLTDAADWAGRIRR